MHRPLDPLHDTRRLRGLPAPVKNNYFYGMLLTDEVLSKEQHYLDGKRWLLNRSAVGKGVLSGLDFTIEAAGRVKIQPGVAVDGLGREIVVPVDEGWSEVEISAEDEHHSWGALTNSEEFLAALGIEAPTTPPDPANPPTVPAPITLLLEIAYDDNLTDHHPVKAGHCSKDCEPATRREGFRLRVRKVETDPRKGDFVALDQEWTRTDTRADNDNPFWPVGGILAEVFPPEPGENVRHRSAAQDAGLAATSTPDPDSGWVTVGQVKLTVEWDGAKAKSLKFTKTGRYYRQLFSNEALSKLVFGLADRVDEAARVRVLTFDGIAGESGNGQTANVYQPLAKALKVKVIDSNGGEVKDLASVRVRFEVQTPDGGKLSTTEFVAKTPYGYDQPAAIQSVEVTVDPTTGVSEDVFWRLSATLGAHTVSARIVPANPADPPFHPGSQLAFHATAKPTAPTIIGVEFDDPWWLDEKCRKYEWTDHGAVGFRFVFSRKVDEANHLDNWFHAWAVYRFADGCVVAPTKLTFAADLSSTAVCPGDSPEMIWQTEGRLEGLYHHLCPHDSVRIVIVGKVGADAELKSPASDHYPNPQALDADFDGSFLTTELCDHLFKENNADFLTAWVGNGAPPAQLLTALPPKRHEPAYPRAADNVEKVLRRFWDCFRPREGSLPTGNGTESGVFHKTFEFRLPCGC